MGVLLGGVPVGLPILGSTNDDGMPCYWNALYDGAQVWPPAAETLTGVWLEPVDFTSQALYSDHPELRVRPVAVYADGHSEPVDDYDLSVKDTATATVSDGNLISVVSDTTTMPAALGNDAFNAFTVGVNLHDDAGRMTVLYRSPSTATKSVVMYYRLNTDAANDAQPHGSVDMRLISNGFFKADFEYDGSAPYTLTFKRDSDDNQWTNPPKQEKTGRRLVCVTSSGASGTVSYPPSGSVRVHVQADQPSTATIGSLWCRTEKTHNNLKYYTGSVGDDANVMCFLIDRIREVWRREWNCWKLLTGKELE